MLELFPRLPRRATVELRDRYADLEVQALTDLASDQHDQAFFTATGGTRVSRDSLSRIRADIVALAGSMGFPDDRAQQGLSRFDADCARYLYESAGIPLPEAFRADVWSFLTLVLLPDVAAWRFPGLPLERCSGGVRDTFRRLWQRAFHIAVADDSQERWDLLQMLSEDAMVQILERPGLAANPRIARSIAEAWEQCAAAIGAARMEDVHRAAVRNVRAVYPLICLDVLDERQLSDLIIEKYRAAVALQAPDQANVLIAAEPVPPYDKQPGD